MAGLLMGGAMIPPVALDAVERGGPSNMGIGIAAAGCVLVVGGGTALAAGLRRHAVTSTPSGARVALAANILFLAFFSLEFSDLMVRQGGKFIYWTNFLFPPALVLFWGLLKTCRWAWSVSRAITALGVLWFAGFSVLIPFGNIQSDGVPASWTARLYMICVSLVFASVLMCAFRAIGHPETRSHFGVATHSES